MFLFQKPPFPKNIGHPMMLEMEKEGKREREKNLASPQSSLLELWTRCSFCNYSVAQSDLSFTVPLSASCFFGLFFLLLLFFTFKLSCPPLSGNSEDIRNNIDDTMMM